MAIKTQEQKIADLQQEVRKLRSFVIGIAGKDPEGEYNPNFIKSIIEVSKEEPTEEFEDSQSFLKSLQ